MRQTLCHAIKRWPIQAFFWLEWGIVTKEIRFSFGATIAGAFKLPVTDPAPYERVGIDARSVFKITQLQIIRLPIFPISPYD